MKMLKIFLVIVCCIIYNVSYAQTYDPRGLTAYQVYYQGMYRKNNLGYLYGGNFVAIDQNNFQILGNRRSWGRNSLAKVEEFKAFLKNAIKKNQQVAFPSALTTSNYFPISTAEPIWRDLNPKDKDTLDPRNMLVTLKGRRLQIWNKNKIVFSEEYKNKKIPDLLEKAFQLKAQIAEACADQVKLKLVVKNGKWAWLEVGKEKLNSPDSNDGYEVVLGKGKVGIYKNKHLQMVEQYSGIIEMESDQLEAKKKVASLNEQILEACRTGTPLILKKTENKKWGWLELQPKKPTPKEAGPAEKASDQSMH